MKIKIHNRKANIIKITLTCVILLVFVISVVTYLSGQKPESIVDSYSSNESIYVPIIMYHGILESKDNISHDRSCISPKLFESDLKYLKDNNYTPIFMEDLISYVEKGTPLPEKPIILTFDDGYYNNYFYAYPLLRAYNMKAVISVIGALADKFSLVHDDNIRYSHLTWHQISEMEASGLVEIENHTYNMHTFKGRKGILNKPGESSKAYETALYNDIGLFQDRIKEMTGKAPNTFTYPFGYVNDKSRGILLKDIGFKATLSTYIGINHITHDPDCLYRLKRIPRPSGISGKNFFRKVAPESMQL